jgi:hypothetical protein
MSNRIAVAVILLAAAASAQSTKSVYRAPRTQDGTPDLQGIWQAGTTAWSGLEAHGAAMGIQAGKGVVVDPQDGTIPYQAWAIEKRDANFKDRAKLDPLAKCYLPGVPRVNLLPYPFQIFQTAKYVAVAYEFGHATRTIYMNGSKHLDNIDFWMGDSRGRWEGEALVVDVADHNASTWFDASGDFHSEAMHLVERYTRTAPDTIEYEAAIEDSKVFTRPWKIRVPFYRHRDPDAQLYEYECHVYLEDETQGRK